MNRTRYLIASCVASGAALILPSIAVLAQLILSRVLPADSSVDVEMRSLSISLWVFGLPVFYLVGCVYHAGVGYMLLRVRRLTLKHTIFVAVVAPWLLMVALIAWGPAMWQGLMALGWIGAQMSLFNAIGALTWWHIAIGR